MHAVLLIVALMLVVGVALAIASQEADTQKRRIVQYVKSRGGTSVEVTWSWGEGDRDTITFNVSYRDPYGHYRHTRCKIHRRGGNKQMYWREEVCPMPPSPVKEQLINDLTTENARLKAQLIQGQTPVVSSSKQAIIDQLIAENERLQAELDMHQQVSSL